MKSYSIIEGKLLDGRSDDITLVGERRWPEMARWWCAVWKRLVRGGGVYKWARLKVKTFFRVGMAGLCMLRAYDYDRPTPNVNTCYMQLLDYKCTSDQVYHALILRPYDMQFFSCRSDYKLIYDLSPLDYNPIEVEHA